MKEKKTDYETLIEKLKEEGVYPAFLKKKQVIYDKLNLGIDNRLMEKVRERFEKQGVIRKTLSETPNDDYVVIFCDDNDLSKKDRSFILQTKHNSKVLFMIMVCPNKIMKEAHDASGLPDIINQKRELSGFPVGVTIEKRICYNFKKYLNFIEQYIEINEIYCVMKSNIDIVEKILFELKGEGDCWWNLFKGWYLQSIEKLIKRYTKYCNKCEQILEEIKANFSEYADACKNEIAEEKYHKENVGDFAADLLFKYDNIQRKMTNNLIELSQSICMNDSTFSLTVNECKEKMNNKPQISFVGNFSSGKTSYINWLLAMEGNQQLRTSGRHNTALLTFIKKGMPEKVFLEYKKTPEIFRWNLFKVEYEIDFADIYKGENNAVVTYVDEVNRVIGYKINNKRKRIVLHNTIDDILVEKNDILTRGIKLTDGAKGHVDIRRDNANIALCDDREYVEIIAAIKQKKLSNCSVTVSYVKKGNLKHKIAVKTDSFRLTDVKDIISFVTRLRNLEKKFDGKNIAFKNVEKSGFWRGQGITYMPNDIEYIYNTIIEGECQFEDINEDLSQSNWKKYCGTGKDGEDVYTETPRGYLFTKQITYYLDKGFLNYADIIDTPGLGSTSDEHDDITERYIRKNVSNLLVMLKIDKNGAAGSRRKFIYEIAKIYEDSERDKNNVFFVCNLWSKDYGKSELKKLEKICDHYYDCIKECEFNQNNFYVIDIQKMQAGHHEQKMFNKYQSDEIFKKVFIKHIAEEGVKFQMKNVNNTILNLFDKRKQDYENAISLLQLKMTEKIDLQEKLSSAKKRIGRLCFDAKFDDLFNKNVALEHLSNLSIGIKELNSRNDWINFIQEIMEQHADIDEIGMLESLCYDDDEIKQYRDLIVDEYTGKLRRLKRYIKDDLDYTDEAPICKSIEDAKNDIKRIGMRGFPFNDLRKRITDQRNLFKSGIHYLYNSGISKQGAKEISDFINNQIIKSKEENYHNYEEMEKKFTDIKKAVLDDINNKIRNISNENYENDTVEWYRQFIIELNNVCNKWKKEISNDEQIKEIII